MKKHFSFIAMAFMLMCAGTVNPPRKKKDTPHT